MLSIKSGESQTQLVYDTIHTHDNQEHIDDLHARQHVSDQQALNKDELFKDWPMFNHRKTFETWELSGVIFRETIMTVLSEISAVFFIALVP